MTIHRRDAADHHPVKQHRRTQDHALGLADIHREANVPGRRITGDELGRDNRPAGETAQPQRQSKLAVLLAERVRLVDGKPLLLHSPFQLQDARLAVIVRTEEHPRLIGQELPAGREGTKGRDAEASARAAQSQRHQRHQRQKRPERPQLPARHLCHESVRDASHHLPAGGTDGAGAGGTEAATAGGSGFGGSGRG